MKPIIKISQASISSINCYTDCGQKWAYKYHYKIPEKPVPAMKIGIANHTALENINRYFQAHGKMPDKTYRHELIDQIIKALPREVMLSNFDSSGTKTEDECYIANCSTLQDQFKLLNDLYVTEASRLFKEIVLIEQEHTIEVASIPFKMITDMVVRYKDNSLAVIDFKTRSKAMNDLSTLQLVAYGMGVEDLLKEKVSALEQWDFIKKAKPEIRKQSFDMSQFESYKQVLKEETETFWHGVHSGHFMRNMKSMYCGPTKCAFWDVCMKPGELEKQRKDTADFHTNEVQNLSTRRNR